MDYFNNYKYYRYYACCLYRKYTKTHEFTKYHKYIHGEYHRKYDRKGRKYMIVYKLDTFYFHNIRGPAIIVFYDNMIVLQYWIDGRFIKKEKIVSDLLECKK